MQSACFLSVRGVPYVAYMRRIGVVVGIAAGVLVLAAAVLLLFANPNRHRQFIQSQLENRLGRKVTLGEMSLGFFPLRFQVKEPVIAEDASIQQPQPFLHADSLNIRISIVPLMRGEIRLDSIELREPEIELVRTKQGIWNFATLGPVTTSGAGSEGSAGTSPDFILERLAIVDGRIGITDIQHNQPRAGYDHIDLVVLNFNPNKSFSFDLAARVEGDSAQQMRLNGQAGPVSASSPSDTPFRGVLTLNQVRIEGLLKFFNAESSANAKGILSGQSELANTSGELTNSGQIRLEGAQIHNLDIGYPIGLDYKLSARMAEGLITIERASLQLGQTPLALTGILNTAARVPRLDVNIKSGEVAVTEIARLLSAFGVAFPAGSAVSGRIVADLRANGPIARPELTGTIGGRELRISGAGIPQPVDIRTLDLALTPAAIRSDEFTAVSGTTKVLGKFSLLQYASNSPEVDIALKGPGATLPEIQSIAKAYGITGLDQISGEGSLDFDLRARGLLQSFSAAAVVKALNGTIHVNFSPLQLAGFNIARELAQVGGFAPSIAEQNHTDVLRLVGSILVKEGVAQTNDLKMQLGIGNLSATGTADLATEALNLKISTVFSKQFSDKVGSTGAGGIMNVAFANAAGELVLPAIVTGNFKQPKFSPDLNAIVQLQKKNAVDSVLGVLAGKNKPAAEKAAEPKSSVVKKLFGIFGRKNDAPAKE
jgi:uncharacterized protein involved in outer membrane biogenesis